MPKDTERTDSIFPRVEVSETRMLVDPAKSRRLREMLIAKNAGLQDRPERVVVAVELENPFELPHDVLRELQKARQIIDEEIGRIMSLFPEGRKNSLFKLRFGTLEEIRAKEVRAIFKLLKLDPRCTNLNRLQKINYYGEKVF
ncbi:MAG: hypothetical protein ACR65R_02975 [Methylomicrobium sp.]